MSEALIKIRLEPLEEGGYLATSDDLPGLLAQGRTIGETLEIAQDVARKLLESYLDHGDPLPPALTAAVSESRELEIPLDFERQFGYNRHKSTLIAIPSK